jgi:hypothetical protein
MVGMQTVARARPDGTTLLLTTTTAALLPAFDMPLPIDPQKDLTAVAQLADIPVLLGVSTRHPAKTLAEFAAWLKAQPGTVPWATSSTGGLPHLWGDAELKLGRKMEHILYKAAAEACAPRRPRAGLRRHDADRPADPRRRARLIVGAPGASPPARCRPAGSACRTSRPPSFGVTAPAGTPADVIATYNGAINAALSMARADPPANSHRRHAAGLCRAAGERNRALAQGDQGGQHPAAGIGGVAAAGGKSHAWRVQCRRHASGGQEAAAEDRLRLHRGRRRGRGRAGHERDAFRQHRIVPRYLVDVSVRDQSTTLFGRTYSSPIGIAPTGLAGLFRRGADLMLAEAARDANVPFIMSGSSTGSMEALGKLAPDHGWYQLYSAKDQAVSEDMIKRAGDAGLRTLVFTVDVPEGSNRERNEERLRPLKLTWAETRGCAIPAGWRNT